MIRSVEVVELSLHRLCGERDDRHQLSNSNFPIDSDVGFNIPAVASIGYACVRNTIDFTMRYDEKDEMMNEMEDLN